MGPGRPVRHKNNGARTTHPDPPENDCYREPCGGSLRRAILCFLETIFITPARAFSKTHPRLKTARGLLATRHFVFSRNHIHHAGSRIFENSPPPTEVLLRRKSLRSLTALFDGFQCKRSE